MRVIVAGRLSQLVGDRDQTGLDSQEREAVRWAESEGHEVVAVVADFKSGKSHLWDRTNLRPWVTEPELLGQYDALVALKVDRLTRADDEGVDAMKAWAREHGKALLISSAGARFPSEGTDGIIWDTMIRVAHAEWLAISERYRRMQRTLREDGSAVGRAPWGFEIARVDGRKLFVPTDLGRQYVPQIFARLAEGQSLRAVAQWLDSEGVPTEYGNAWNEGFLGRMVRNTIYRGERHNGGRVEVEALVSTQVWETAGATLAGRATKGRGTVVREATLLQPVCASCYGQSREGCKSGVSPMYRVYVGAKGKRIAYYRCSGHGPQRKGCGARMVPVEDLDSMVVAWYTRDPRPHEVKTFRAGRNVAEEIASLNKRISEAVAALDYSTVGTLSAEAEALKNAEDARPSWTREETGQTRGWHFLNLDHEGRRTWIAEQATILAERAEDGSLRIAEAFRTDDDTEVINRMI